jgi:hypothetical protein
MNTQTKTMNTVTLRYLPLVASVVLATTHPALASNFTASGALAGINTGATAVETAMQAIGIAGCVIGLVFAAFHFFTNREDWFGVAMRVLGAVVGGVIVSNAATIVTLGGAVTF